MKRKIPAFLSAAVAAVLQTTVALSPGTIFAETPPDCALRISPVKQPKHAEVIWNSTPAKIWSEATPIGNGRLGAMIPGGVLTETITLNEDSLWSGEPRNYQRPGDHKVLPAIRKLIFEGKTKEAEKLITSSMLGPYNESYQPLGNLTLRFLSQKASVANYRRELDLKTGIATSSYELDGVKFERETFASYPDDVIVFQIQSEQKKISLDILLTSLLKNVAQNDALKNQIVLVGNAPIRVEPDYTGKRPPKYEEGKGMKFVSAIHVVSKDGTIEKNGAGEIHIRDASSVKIYFTAKTSYSNPWTNPAISTEKVAELVKQNLGVLERAVRKTSEELKAAHVADYQALYNRVKLDIPQGQVSTQEKPIEQRIKEYTTKSDPQLAALYYQFGRYLLISGSRPKSQALNLQGIWNKDIQPAWSANWTMNCNAEINYWGVETANLSELFEPFVQLTKELTVDGSKTAKNLYNARGWVAHHNIDLWRTTYPVGQPAGIRAHWALFQIGAAWACQPVYDHYLYSGDKAYLADVYPVIKGSALFFLDTLQEDANGFLVTNPSISFENFYLKTDGAKGWASYGSMQDTQIVRSVLRNTLEAAKILGRDAPLQEELAKALKRLPPNKVSPSRGDLQEWFEDWAPININSGGGQTAHGWALNPDWEISPITTPELAAAFRKTLEIRQPWENHYTSSWIGSMSAGNYARLFDGKMVEMILDRHITRSVKPSLVSVFGGAGKGSWQIDGNLGMSSAIGETLLQSRPVNGAEGIFEIHLLPALFPSWTSGRASGLCARGGYVVDITWKDGALQSATILAKLDGTCRLRTKTPVTIRSKGKEIPVKILGDGLVEFPAKSGEKYEIVRK